MKRTLLPAMISFGLFVLGSFHLEPSSAQVNPAGRSSLPSRQDPEMANTVRRLTSRSIAGLVQKKIAGGYQLDLEERFQSIPLGKVDADGDTAASCVTSVEEANDFFGRDLETGEIYPAPPVSRDDVAKQAALREMSVDEFQFYKDLIDAAAARRQANPNSATLEIVNSDGPGEGFYDTAARTPEGGNTGATLGEQRLNLFNFAAAIWGSFLDSSVPIKVNSQFNPLTPCSPSGGVLGSAGGVSVFRNFSGAEFPNTWYPVALANKKTGSDMNSTGNEINTTFNSSVDTGCLGAGTRFYYGLDNSRPSGTINLLVVLLHEMGHGLGFQTFANGSTGVLLAGFPDTYSRYMFDRSINLYWFEMTNAQRQTSALNTGNLMWDGPSVKIGSGALTAGRDAATGRVQLFAPAAFQSGSSISHWDTASSPNLLMEPSINSGLPIDLDMTRQQMRDIGWHRDTNADLTPDTITDVLPSGSVVAIGSNIDITWASGGGFGNNVTIELSTDGGATFPTAIATNIPNIGTFSFQVPNTPTTQAQIRVREHNFVAPAGVSSANFTITTIVQPFANVSGRVLTPDGRGLRNAIVSITDPQNTVRTVTTSSFGFYSFDNVPTLQQHTLRVASKRYRFSALQAQVDGDLVNVDFTGLE